MPSDPTPEAPRVSALDKLGATPALMWLALALFELALATALPDGALRRPSLPWAGRVAIVGGDLTILTIGVLGVGFAHHLARRVSGPAARRVRAVLAVALALVVGIALAGSWGAYHQTGAFAGRDALEFASRSGTQIAQHVAQQSVVLFFAVPLGGLSLAVVLAIALPRLARRLDASARRRVVVGAGAGSAFALLAALAGHATLGRSTIEVRDPSSGASLEQREIFVYERDYHGGALWAAARALMRGADGAHDANLVVRDDIAVQRRSIVEMPRYVATAREKGFRALNVITVIVESLRRDQLTALGSNRVVMPHLEALARSGRVFSNVYTQASHSDLADPCVLSSHYPVRGPKGARAYTRNPSYPRVLVYDVMHALGHRTALISSQNETWGGMLDFLDTGGLDRILHSETFDGPTYVPRDDPTFARWIKGTKRAGKIDDRLTVGEAIKWVEEDLHRPFFIYLNLQNSHIPYELPADFPRRFAQRGDEIAFTMAKIAPGDVAVARNLYADSLAYVDAQLGRLLDRLDALGLRDETVIVVTGDTGQAFMEHGFFTHARDLYNEVMRVPVVVSAPGLAPGVDERLAQHIDIPPTILDLLGLPPHPSFQGTSLLAPNPPPQRSAYLTVRTPFAHQYSVVKGKHKLISDQRKHQVLLYDLESDPGETRDLARLKPRVAKRLLGRLETWLHHQIAYYGDPKRQANEYPPVLAD